MPEKVLSVKKQVKKDGKILISRTDVHVYVLSLMQMMAVDSMLRLGKYIL